MKFSFGQSEHERIEVDVLNYERVPTGEYWDDNWIFVIVLVQAGGFHGRAKAAFLTAELVTFTNQLRPLYETLKGIAEFKTMEGQLHLKLTGDGKGHIELNGTIADQSGIGNELSFKLDFDQSQLANSILELEKVLAAFPVRKV